MILHKKYEKRENGCIAFKGTNCINNMSDHALELKEEKEKLEKFKKKF